MMNMMDAADDHGMKETSICTVIVKDLMSVGTIMIHPGHCIEYEHHLSFRKLL